MALVRVFSGLFFFSVLLLAASGVNAQSSGSISGIVLDQSTGEPALGVNIVIAGTTLGSATGLDGRFSIGKVPAGTYDLKVSGVGYATQTISKLVVAAREDATLKITMVPETYDVQEVVVAAEAVRSTESALIQEQRKSGSILDGLSAEQIKRAPDATSGDVLKRVSGISIVDNKFVFIRGVTDRYNVTTLNGARVSGAEAEKKSFSFDLLPSNLLENTIVIKSATPDLPGDFTGGMVQLNTLDFPNRRLLNLSIASSYNTVATQNTLQLGQNGGRDWFGSDDGARAFPDGEGLSGPGLGQRLPNRWASKSRRVPFNGSYALSLGDRLKTDMMEFGLIGALSYRFSYQRTKIALEDRNEAGEERFQYGNRDEYGILWGGLVNASVKFSPNHKVSLKNNYNRTGSNKYSITEGTDPVDTYQKNYLSSWSERSIYTGQVIGEHTFEGLSGLLFNWSATFSSGKHQDPDRLSLQYTRSDPSDPYRAEPGQRSWSDLDDRSRGVNADFTLPLGSSSVKFGAFTESKMREYKVRYYQVDYRTLSGASYSYILLPIDSIYMQDHFGAGKFSMAEVSKPSDQYQADHQLHAGYTMIDIPFHIAGQRFRFVGGARLENSHQHVNTAISLSSKFSQRVALDDADLLPSMNLTYRLNEWTNVRLAYSQSVNRPEFRELATIYYYDFNKFEAVVGNTTLQRALIRNFDVRVEMFPGLAEVIAVSYFHKNITSAIEEQVVQTAVATRTFINSDKGVNYGWEIEVRKSLGFLGGFFHNFSVGGNYSRIFSSIDYDFVSGGSTNTTVERRARPLQGQSPYTVNLNVTFLEPNLGTGVNILFNRFGSRLDAVGYFDDDIYEKEREVIDLSVSQDLGSFMNLKFSVKDLASSDRILSIRDKVYRKESVGTSYSFQLGLSL